LFVFEERIYKKLSLRFSSAFFLPPKLTILGKTGIALSQDKLCITETGLNYRQSKAVVSTDLPSRAQILAESIPTAISFMKAGRSLNYSNG